MVFFECPAEGCGVGISEVSVKGGQAAYAAAEPAGGFLHTKAFKIDAEVDAGSVLELVAEIALADVKALAELAQAQTGIRIVLLQVDFDFRDRIGGRGSLDKEAAKSQRVGLQGVEGWRCMEKLVQLIQLRACFVRLRRRNLEACFEQRVLQVGEQQGQQ